MLHFKLETAHQNHRSVLAHAPEKRMSATAPITDANPTVAEMEARVARFKSLATTDDYLDCKRGLKALLPVDDQMSRIA